MINIAFPRTAAARRAVYLAFVTLSPACTCQRPAPPAEAEPAPAASAVPPMSSAAPATAVLPSASPHAAPPDAGAPPHDPQTFVVWEPRGPRAAIARGAWVTIIDARDQKPLTRLGPHATEVSGLAFSDDGKLLAVEESDASIHVWSTADGVQKATLSPGPGTREIHGLAISHDDASLVASYQTDKFDNATAVWDLATGARLPAQAPEGGPFFRLTFLVDNRHIAGFDPASVVTWDMKTGKETSRRSFDTGGTSPVALSPDGNVAATAAQLHAVLAWRLGTADVVTLGTVSDCAAHFYGVHFARDSKTLIVHSQAGFISSFNVPSLTPRTTWRPKHRIEGEDATMSDDGAVVIRVLPSGPAELWDAFKDRKLRDLEGTVSVDELPDVSPDHSMAATGGEHPAVWDLGTGKRALLDDALRAP